MPEATALGSHGAYQYPLTAHPVRALDPLAFALGQLGVEVARAVHAAALAVRSGPALLDRLDQPGGAVGDDQHRRAQAARDQIAPERLPVLGGLAHPEHHRQRHALALLGKPPGDQHALLGPVVADRDKRGVEEQRHQPDVVEVATRERRVALAQLRADP
jgi:hypothetical protein